MTLWAAAVLAAAAAFTWGTPPFAVTRVRPHQQRSPRPRLVAVRAAMRKPEPHARDVAALAKALAAELRAGRAPTAAWDAVVTGWSGPLPGVWVAGADVPLVLRRWSRAAGWGGLTTIAICWRLADETGAGLADALDQVAESMRHEHEIAAEVQSQLSGVRATASVLATLPFIALGMGTLLGVDPVAVLLGTPLGRICLLVGVVLAATGWGWLTAQVESVQRSLRW
jgi:tight adherence protein B